jgi:hypothetical protein
MRTATAAFLLTWGRLAPQYGRSPLVASFLVGCFGTDQSEML